MNNHYNNQLKTYASELRTETVSRAEKYLWKAGLSRKIKIGMSKTFTRLEMPIPLF